MGQQPRELHPYRSPTDFFGAELRRRRLAHGLSLKRLSSVVHYDASLLAKIERAERSASDDLAAACDAALNADGALIHLWQYVRHSRTSRTGLHVDDMGTNSGSAASSVLTGDIIPLTAVISGQVVAVEVDRRSFLQAMVSAGMGSVLGTLPASPSTLRRPVDPGVVDHFARLRAALVDADNLLGPQRLLSTVQQQLAIMDDLRRNSGGTLRRQLLATQSRWAEFAGWLSDDTGDVITGTIWTDHAMEMAQAADDPTWVAYILARKAQRATRSGAGDRVVDLGRAAQRTPQLPPLVRAFAYLQQAQGHALTGEARDCDEAVGAADELIAAHTGTAEVGGFCTMSYLRQQQADCWLAQRRPDRAVAAFEAALDQWPANMQRDRGLCLARLASAHLAGERPDPDRASTVATQAYQLGVATGSARVLADLDRVAAALTPWRSREPVKQFLELMSARSAAGTPVEFHP